MLRNWGYKTSLIKRERQFDSNACAADRKIFGSTLLHSIEFDGSLQTDFRSGGK